MNYPAVFCVRKMFVPDTSQWNAIFANDGNIALAGQVSTNYLIYN